MSDLGDAIGTAAEGSLIASAVEDETGTPLQDGYPAEGACKNCGTKLIGSHCHGCGQKGKIHRTITAFMHDLLHGALHFEGKIWRTLPMLAFKPGKLTRRYIDGERARFVSPMALFLFSVFLMFAAFQIAGISTPTTIDGQINVNGAAETFGEQVEGELETAEQELSALEPGDPERAEAEAAVADLREAAASFSKITEAASAEENSGIGITATGIESFDQGIVKKWNENPGLMLYKLQNNSYKFSWLLIPLSIPGVWLLFLWKRQFRAYDHAIFVTYSLSFMSLFFLSLTMLGKLGVPFAILALPGAVIPPIHIYKQLRGGYELSRFSAFWRTTALLQGIIFGVLIGFFWLLILLGAF